MIRGIQGREDLGLASAGYRGLYRAWIWGSPKTSGPFWAVTNNYRVIAYWAK